MLEKMLKEALQKGLDQWSGGKYALDIEIREQEVHSRDGSEVIEVYPVLVYLVSCAGLTYELTGSLPELSSKGSGTVSCGQTANGEIWRIEFPSARRLYYEATDFFKQEAFKRLLDE